MASTPQPHQNRHLLYALADGGVRERAGSVRVLCWVPTSPLHHRSRAQAIKQTWARHCDHYLFFSTQAGKLQYIQETTETGTYCTSSTNLFASNTTVLVARKT